MLSNADPLLTPTTVPGSLRPGLSLLPLESQSSLISESTCPDLPPGRAAGLALWYALVALHPQTCVLVARGRFCGVNRASSGPLLTVTLVMATLLLDDLAACPAPGLLAFPLLWDHVASLGFLSGSAPQVSWKNSPLSFIGGSTALLGAAHPPCVDRALGWPSLSQPLL